MSVILERTVRPVAGKPTIARRPARLAILLLIGLVPLAIAAEAQVFTQFVLPTPARPYGITTGPDGNLWFMEFSLVAGIPDKVGRITTTGTFTEFPIREFVGPFSIAAGPDGNLWFTEQSTNLIGRISPTGLISEFPIPTPSSLPTDICAGPDGNVWFTEALANKIGRITPNGSITEFDVPTLNVWPWGIAAGADGNLWFTERFGPNTGRITPEGDITEFPSCYGGSDITAGPDGNLWFTLGGHGGSCKISTDGAVSGGAASGISFGISSSPDGDIWAASWSGKTVFRTSLQGEVASYPVPATAPPTHDLPHDITVGPDGNIWVTLVGAQVGAIGRLCPEPRGIGSSLRLSRTQSLALATWLDSGTATAYTLYQDLEPSGPFSEAAGTGVSGVTGISIPLDTSKAALLCFRISASNQCGESQ